MHRLVTEQAEQDTPCSGGNTAQSGTRRPHTAGKQCNANFACKWFQLHAPNMVSAARPVPWHAPGGSPGRKFARCLYIRRKSCRKSSEGAYPSRSVPSRSVPFQEPTLPGAYPSRSLPFQEPTLPGAYPSRSLPFQERTLPGAYPSRSLPFQEPTLPGAYPSRSLPLQHTKCFT